jgi:hypothetical protein
MQHMRFLLGLAAPLALLAGPALAQQGVPPAGPDPSGASDTNQTRALENQIEEYPGPTDGVRDESDVDTRIPEQIHPAPRSNAGPRPHAASPAAPARSGGATAAIDPSEVQRVFGSDTGVIALGSLDPTSITQLQVRLRERGYDPGPVDGVVGPTTRAALEGYARAQFTLKQRLLQQDQLTTDLAEQLGVAPGSRRGAQPSMRDDARPATPPGDAPLLPPGGAPLPPPGMAPLPTPSSSPSGGVPAPRGGATPSHTPPSP